MRVGVFGGSFNPIHLGHVELAAEALRSLELDQVLFIPTANPPHKQASRLAPAWRRYVMVELALLDHDWAHASPRELQPETAYTIDTLETLTIENPGTEWVLLIGSDSLGELTTWRRWRDLLAFEIGVLVRSQEGSPEPGTIPDVLDGAGGHRIRWVDNTLSAASSTAIRDRLASGDRPDGLHPRVLDYISKYSLYR